jgi:hypothetical protein
VLGHEHDRQLGDVVDNRLGDDPVVTIGPADGAGVRSDSTGGQHHGHSKHTVPWLTPGPNLLRSGDRLCAEFVCGLACDVSKDIEHEHAPESVYEGRRGVGGIFVEVNDRAR